MPPKQRITREMILDKSFDMFRSEGMEGVNARSVAKALNCSTQPIFSYFDGMDDLKSALEQRAKEVFSEAVATVANEGLGSVCTAYARFAGEQPRLFAHLFMQIAAENVGEPLSKELRARVTQLEAQREGLSDEQAQTLCASAWVYAHGLASACAVGLLTLDDEQIASRIARQLEGELLRLKQA